MKKNVLFIFLIVSNFAFSQNLVPNPSFENYNFCPSSLAQIAYSPSHTLFPVIDKWVNPHGVTTSDYYNSCATISSKVNLPNAFLCYKNARTGKGAAGIIPYAIETKSGGARYSEYIQCKLLQNLKANYSYNVSFYVSYCYSPNIGWPHNYIALDKIGAHFGDTAIYNNSSTTLYLNAPYHVSSLAGIYMSDTTAWVKINSVYKAKGGERYMTIGCFNDGSQVNYIPVLPIIPKASENYTSYYFIDDVLVEEMPKCDTIFQSSNIVSCNFEPFNMLLSPTIPLSSSYYWNTGDNTNNITIVKTGIYWCRSTSGCNLTLDTFHVKLPEITQTASKDTLVCKGSSLTLTALTASQYLWSTGHTNQSVLINKEGIYYCKKITNCQMAIDTFRITNYPSINLDLGPDSTICAGDDFKLSMPDSYIKYKWNTGDTGYSIQVTKTGKYIVDGYNECESKKDTVNIDVVECYDCLFIPNAFTPNGDGKNDFFRVLKKCSVYEFAIKIYNRWGEQVFMSNDINKSWDGRYKGLDVDIESYSFYAEYRPISGKHKEMIKGTITLIR